MATDFEQGVLIGLLIGEGHFGGDGRQPQVTLRMHVRHSALFRWIERTFPGGRTYGPYDHGGRHYLQWMARGAFLREQLAPFLDEHLSEQLDSHSKKRFDGMVDRYPTKFTPRSQVATEEEPGPAPTDAFTTDRLDHLFGRLRDAAGDDS